MNWNYFLFGIVIFISAITVYFDSDFLSNNSTSKIIDCESISVVNFNTDEGLVTIQVRIPETFEYPKQTVFSFLSLNVVTYYFSNSQNHFYNNKNAYFYQPRNQTDEEFSDDKQFKFESIFNSQNGFVNSKMTNSTDIIFDIFYQFYGHHYLNLKCHNSNIFSTEFVFNNITHFQPNTTIVESPSKFKNICYGDEYFYAILPQTGNFPNIIVGDYSFPFRILKKANGFHLSSNSSFLFTNFRYDAWQQILFQLTPILNIVKGSDEVLLFTVTKNDKYVKMPSAFKSRVLTYSNLHERFENLEILSEINKFEIYLKPFNFDKQNNHHQETQIVDYSSFINEALFDQNFSITREVALKKPIIKEKFAISSDLYSHFHAIEEQFPYIEILEISEDTTCAQMARELGEVSVLIGTKISELIGAVFLNEDAIVVDMQSYRCFCGDWMKKFASDLRLKYISFEQECDCDDFSCSDLIDWESPIDIDEKEMLAIIDQLF